MLLGFVGAFQLSELAGLDVRDLVEHAKGLVVTVRRSKLDLEAVGFEKAIPFGADAATCPVRAMRAWLEAVRISDGPLFRPSIGMGT